MIANPRGSKVGKNWKTFVWIFTESQRRKLALEQQSGFGDPKAEKLALGIPKLKNNLFCKSHCRQTLALGNWKSLGKFGRVAKFGKVGKRLNKLEPNQKSWETLEDGRRSLARALAHSLVVGSGGEA